MTAPRIAPLLLTLAGLLSATSVLADPPGRRGPPTFDYRHGPVWLDGRYHHDHYYPSQGYVLPVLPTHALSIGFGPDRFYFHAGVWFRPYNHRYLVVLPPVGIRVPVLPPGYATVWVGSVPYYYANGVYYATAPGAAYEVVNPPPGVSATQPEPPTANLPAPPSHKPAPNPVIYPRNGQSAKQTEADKQECNRWATTQAEAMADGEVFARAVAACLEGRGYTVR